MWYFSQSKGTGFLLAVLLGVALIAGCQPAKPSTHDKAMVKPTQEQLQKVELLNQTADDMYDKVMKGDVTGGRNALQQIGEQLTQIRYEGLTTVEGMNALTETVTDAKRVFNAVRFSPIEGQVSAAKIRLAADALTHTAQPMWLQYYKILQNDLDQLDQTAKQQKKTDMQQTEQQFEQHLSVIHPSLLISSNPSDVEKLDSLTRYLSGQVRSDQDTFKQVINILPTVRQHLDKLFMKREATAYLPIVDDQNPILWILAIGSFIIAALGFAGWRLAKKDGGLVSVKKPTEGG
ncbi:sporulation protein YpjB [Paenibacillus piri]|uniref:Sporulation protein YpjB n=1 Tax=Paenibacillus piri TaxID=2547395 RepID=A0A4R5KTY1_9BACL|nr:sporulation protein YpjB [Paenibacillus piri]TDF99369.1 hypothetical protein E1757_05810 [Paenibacillus piri]